MKALLPVTVGTLLLLSAISAGPASARTPAAGPQGGSEQEIALDARVAALEKEVVALRAENAELRALMDQTVAYLQSQSKASEAMLGVLDSAEREGFTAGINFRSREVLLAGFRSFWGGLKSGAPAPKKAPEPETPRPGAARTGAAGRK